MIVVTHEMGFARKAADRVLFMADGQIVEEATPERVLHEPAERPREGLPLEDPRALRPAPLTSGEEPPTQDAREARDMKRRRHAHSSQLAAGARRSRSPAAPGGGDGETEEHRRRRAGAHVRGGHDHGRRSPRRARSRSASSSTSRSSASSAPTACPGLRRRDRQDHRGELGIDEDNIEWTESVSANREPFIENGEVDFVVGDLHDQRQAQGGRLVRRSVLHRRPVDPGARRQRGHQERRRPRRPARLLGDRLDARRRTSKDARRRGARDRHVLELPRAAPQRPGRRGHRPTTSSSPASPRRTRASSRSSASRSPRSPTASASRWTTPSSAVDQRCARGRHTQDGRYEEAWNATAGTVLPFAEPPGGRPLLIGSRPGHVTCPGRAPTRTTEEEARGRRHREPADCLARLPRDPPAARRRRCVARSSSARSSRRCGSRRSRRCARSRRSTPRSSATPRSPSSSSSSRSCCRCLGSRLDYVTSAIIGAHDLHVAVRRRGAALGHQQRAGRAGRGGAQRRARLRADDVARRAAAGVPHDDPAADQRLHRAHEEHVGGRRASSSSSCSPRPVSSRTRTADTVIAILLAVGGPLPRGHRPARLGRSAARDASGWCSDEHRASSSTCRAQGPPHLAHLVDRHRRPHPRRARVDRATLAAAARERRHHAARACSTRRRWNIFTDPIVWERIILAASGARCGRR